MEKKKLTQQEIERMADEAILRHAEEENADFGIALKHISQKELESILASNAPERRALKWRERFIWAVSVAALLAVAITLPLTMRYNSRQEVDNIVFDYNACEWGQSRDGEETTLNLSAMTEDQIKAELPELEEKFAQSETAQETAINGKLLALAYIRLHERGPARRVLEEMISTLEGDNDYAAVVEQCRMILKQI